MHKQVYSNSEENMVKQMTGGHVKIADCNDGPGNMISIQLSKEIALFIGTTKRKCRITEIRHIPFCKNSILSWLFFKQHRERR